MAELTVDGLRKVYPNGQIALAGLDHKIADGERLVLVGPSGSGKTTVLRLVAGLDPPTAGNVRFGAQDVTTWPAQRRGVGMVFQRPALYPFLNVRENLLFGQRLREEGWRGWLPSWLRRPSVLAMSRCDAVANLLGLQALLDRMPHQLSGGEQQRVGLGRALVRSPSLLLMDEPLSALEPGRRRGLRDEFRRLFRKEESPFQPEKPGDLLKREELGGQLHLLRERIPATILYVTHDQEEALTLGDRVAVLDQGTLQQVGPPSELLDRPANRFVAGFLGWPPRSFLDGRLQTSPDGLVFAGPAGVLNVPAHLAAVWQRLAGQAATLGLRPEQVRCGEQGTATGSSLTMTVDGVERLGSATLIHLVRQDWRLTSLQIGPGPIRLFPGETIVATLDLSGALLFDERGNLLRARA
jgi:multiple sugar transport system ATP-binding protein